MRNFILGSILLLAFAATASAQQPTPSTNTMIVEQIQSGWLFSPDVRAADLGGETADAIGPGVARSARDHRRSR